MTCWIYLRWDKKNSERTRAISISRMPLLKWWVFRCLKPNSVESTWLKKWRTFLSLWNMILARYLIISYVPTVRGSSRLFWTWCLMLSSSLLVEVLSKLNALTSDACRISCIKSTMSTLWNLKDMEWYKYQFKTQELASNKKTKKNFSNFLDF